MYDFDILDDAIEERENVLLTGPTGPGKTTFFRAYAAARGLPFYSVNCKGDMDTGTVIGRTTIDAEGKVRWIDGRLTLIVRYGGVVLFDEINMSHPRITAAWHDLLAVTRSLNIDETGDVIKAGAGGTGGTKNRQPTLFGAACNLGYRGVVELNEALRNRFPVPLKWGYDHDVESQMVRSTHLLDVADHVRNLSEIRSAVSTNMLQEFERHALKRGMQWAVALFVGHFEDDESTPVARALEAQANNIAKDLGIA
jgi:MoxR-like ATPase